jgi:hypothetical protein
MDFVFETATNVAPKGGTDCLILSNTCLSNGISGIIKKAHAS